VTDQQKPEGAFFLWKWGDREIENPKIVKAELIKICSEGFSGVLVAISGARYELIDWKVLQTVAQVSQWAKKRNIAFWFHTDPRQASRTLISKTGERTQNLIVTRKSRNRLNRKNLNITRVTRNHFELRYEYPRVYYSPLLQEISLCFEPAGLEKTFLFQIANGVILKDTVRDITSVSHFFTNIAEGYAEVFGDVKVPDDEEWWVMAFPKFDTNLYDYAGRKSNDLLYEFIENLFDACAHLDGTTWGRGGTGYLVEMGRFPVSLSLYNSFLAEYGYDLREVLYGLVLNVDDESHIHIRCNYYSLLMDIVFGAQQDFFRAIHSFFNHVNIGLHHTCNFQKNQADSLVQGNVDPWRSLDKVNVIFTEVNRKKGFDSDYIIPTLVIAKSFSIFSQAKTAFLNLGRKNYSKEELSYLIDLMGLFSVKWLSSTRKAEEWNKKIDLINNITGFRSPEANVALVFPTETIMAIGTKDAEEIIESVRKLITKLVKAGIWLDVISTAFLKDSRISSNGIQIKEQKYSSVIFPYPEILDPKVLDIVSAMDKRGLNILLGGSKPRFTSTGKRIPHVFRLVFDPRDEDLSPLWNSGIKPLFKAPVNSLISLIPQGEANLFLVCPKELGEIVEGDVQYGKVSFSIPKSSGLIIFRQDSHCKIEQVL